MGFIARAAASFARRLARWGLSAVAPVVPFRERNLTIVNDGAGWILDELAANMQQSMLECGWKAAVSSPTWAFREHVFLCDQFALRQMAGMHPSVRLSFAYFHGDPGQGQEFASLFELVRRNCGRFFRVQVTHDQMQQVCLEAGLSSSQVRKIPIGVDCATFRPTSVDARSYSRRRLGLPESAFVIGSFQKDGIGWADGFEPKLIKGPDVFVAVLARLREEGVEPHVLLTGPARGYVKRGLSELSVPFVHVMAEDSRRIAELYSALDCYLITARVEGGPKGALDAMASGIPVVSTRVGQAQEIIQHRVNGYLAPVGDVESLTACVLDVMAKRDGDIPQKGIASARVHDYRAQGALWREFFESPA